MEMQLLKTCNLNAMETGSEILALLCSAFDFIKPGFTEGALGVRRNVLGCAHKLPR